MKKLLYTIMDNLFLFVGCALMVVGGMLVSPVLAVYTAAFECLVLACIQANADAEPVPHDKRSTNAWLSGLPDTPSHFDGYNLPSPKPPSPKGGGR